MADDTAAPAPKAQRHRMPNRQKDGSSEQPSTPGRSNPSRQATPSDKHATGYHSSAGRMQKSRSSNRQQQRPYDQVSTAIPNIDGTSSPSKPISIQSKEENRNPLATPAKQAYAGPTFHASPAPSSLPMPRFFSKSLPANSTLSVADEVPSVDTVPQTVLPPSPSPAITANVTSSAAPVQREASPLDILFNAHRAEKAREKSSSSSVNANAGAPAGTDYARSPYQGSTQYPSSSINGQRSATQGRSSGYGSDASRDASLQSSKTPSSKEMFMMEVDAPETLHNLQPSTSLSFEQRLRAAQAQGSPSKGRQAAAMDDDQRLAKSLALKQLLKGQAEERQREINPAVPQDSSFSPPIRVPYRQSTPSTPPNTSTQRPPKADPPDIKAMEAHLRKLLKLNP